MTNKPTEQAALGRLSDEELNAAVLSALPGAVRLPPGWRDTARAIESALLAKQPEATQIAPVDKGSYQRMFEAACVDLGLINEALGLAPEDGGAEPILSAIAELKEQALGQGLTDGGVDKDLPVTRDWQLGWDECIAHFGLDSVAPAALQPPPVGVEPFAWMPYEREGTYHSASSFTAFRHEIAGGVALYTAPPPAQPTPQPVVRPTVTEFNVGRWCRSEFDCIAEGIDFGAYERGVFDAAKAFAAHRPAPAAQPLGDAK